MRKVDNLRQLGDAIELLAMLEQLTSGLAKSEPAVQDIPWGGMRLTLGQAKNLVLKTYDSLCQAGDAEGAAQGFTQALSQDPKYKIDDSRVSEGKHTDANPNVGISAEDFSQRNVSALAGRIQKAPTTSGRVRELVPGPATDRPSIGADQRRKQSSVSAPGDV